MNIFQFLDGKKTAIGAAILAGGAIASQIGITIPVDAKDVATFVGETIAVIGLAHKFWKAIFKPAAK